MLTIDSFTFNTRVEYEKYIIDHANRYSLLFKMGSRLQRIEVESLEIAEQRASNISNRSNKVCMIYANYKDHGCHIKNIYPDK